MLSYQVEAFGKPLARVLRETPRPSGSEVLVKVAACGVCHTDVHLHDGCFDLGGGAKLDLARSVAPPRTLGHEIAGTVVAVGPDVQGVKVGDSRIVFPWIGCGACTLCTAGQEHICIAAQSLGVNRDGGFADHVLVPHARYLVDHGSLPVEQACTYACAGLTAFSALKKAATVSADDGTPVPLGAGDALLILGAGGVGLSGIRLARVLYPDAPIVVAEVDEGRFALALQAGATECLNPNSEGVGRSLFKSTGGGVAAAVDFVGTASTFAFGFGALRKAGRFVAVGLQGGTATMATVALSMKAHTVVGSYVGSLAELHSLMAIARDGRLPPLPVTTRPLAQATQALEDLRQGKVRGRTILLP